MRIIINRIFKKAQISCPESGNAASAAPAQMFQAQETASLLTAFMRHE
jgi:serine protease inhibitor